VTTEFNTIFTGGQLREGVKCLRHFKGLAPSPSSGCCWRLGKIRNKLCVLHSLQQYTEYGDGVSPWNNGELPHLDAAVCPRRFYWKYMLLIVLLFLRSSWIMAKWFIPLCSCISA